MTSPPDSPRRSLAGSPSNGRASLREAARHPTLPVQALLARLEGVRQAGRGWISKCPAHADRSPSLSLNEGVNGTILLHCHAGCAALAVVHAVGLELRDLFPQRVDPMTPEHRRELSATSRLGNRIAALNSIVHEVAVIEVAAGHIVADPEAGLSWSDYERICEAHQKIAAVYREVVR